MKIVLIILLALFIVVIVAALFVNVITLPKNDDDKNVVYVGSMVKSDKISYKDNSGKGILKNPIVKIMQMSWRFCSNSDKKNMSKQNPPKDIELIKNIAYEDDGNLYHMLDVMYPKSVNKSDKLPVIIDIHGGGWMYATKELNENYCRALCDRGYVVFGINYRLVPDVSVCEQLGDVMKALKKIGEIINDYPCDTNNIMLTGDSAGGMLSAYASVLLQSEKLRNVFNTVNPKLNINTLLLTSPVAFMKSAGILSLYTKSLWGKDYKHKATYEFMDFDKLLPYADNMPPTYLITSSGDTLAKKQTIKLYNLLKENGIKCKLANYGNEYGKSLIHVFSVLNPFDKAGNAAIDGAIDFYKENMN